MLDLSEILGSYCDHLLDENGATKVKAIKSCKTKKKAAGNGKQNLNSFKEDLKKHKKIIKKNRKLISSKSTEDASKLHSNLSSNDSDDCLSDSNDNNPTCPSMEKDYLSPMKSSKGCLNANMNKINSNDSLKEGLKTTDGFKIISDIPADDSDVSDAFDDNFSDSEGLDTDTGGRNTPDSNISSDNERENSESSKLCNIKKPLLKIIQDFGMQERIQVNEDLVPYLVPKTSSSSKNSKLPNKEIKIYDYSTKRRKKQEILHDPIEKNMKDDVQTVSKDETEKAFKKAKYEIYKFGLSGFEKRDQRKAKIDLAVKLGAKPPKKKGMNYKSLMEERKKVKQNEVLKREEDRHLGLPVKKKKEIKKNKRTPGAGSLDTQIGKFKDGVLSLSKRDIERISK